MSGLKFFKLNKKVEENGKIFSFLSLTFLGTFSTPLKFRQRQSFERIQKIISVSGWIAKKSLFSTVMLPIIDLT